jgi:hypothetical protein
MAKKFIKKIENFVCEHCGASVVGNGYTNHCPTCLWSKHVDIHPGDRASTCQGLMRPVRVEKDKDEFRICFKCLKCGLEYRNKLSANDNFEIALEIQKTMAAL